jgi:ABC-type multidrug transport system fused ATPase/permease subunit
LVTQEPTLFATSISEKILYGKVNPSTKEIKEAKKAHFFIGNLLNGYNN